MPRVRNWTDEDDIFIIMNINSLGVTALMDHFKCSHYSLQNRLDFLEIQKKEYKAGHFFLDGICYMSVYSEVYPEKYMMIEENDYEKMSHLTWNLKSSSDACVFYAVSRENGVKIQSHRYLLDYDGPLEVDHIDGNGLNNLRSNLRLTTHKQNLQNAKVYKGKKSKYKGVQYAKNARKCWHVFIRRKFVASFVDELEAAKFYDEVAKVEYGEYARLNFPYG